MYHSADCDTGPSLVCSKVRIQPKKLYHSKQTKTKQWIDVAKTSHPDKTARFNTMFTSSLDTANTANNQSIFERWEKLNQPLIRLLSQPLGTGKDAKEIIGTHPLIDTEWDAIQIYKNLPSTESY